MDLCNRIRFLRIKNNLTQKELSEKLGVSVVSISCWENGSKFPSLNALISIAKTFNVSTDYLLGVSFEPERDELLLSSNERRLLSNYRVLDKYGKRAVDTLCTIEKRRVNSEREFEQNSSPAFKNTSTRYIPRYTTPSAAGMSIPLDGDDFEMILVDNTVPEEADFAVGIQGDSMAPYIHDGDTVFVKRVTDLSVGDVGIFSVDGAMYCKQYYIDENKNLTLVSANPEFKHTNVYVSSESSSDVRCYGKVLLNCKIELPDYLYEI